MSILSNQIRLYRSQQVSDLPANGGILSASEIVSGVTANLFDSATVQQRTDGATLYRKMFFKMDNAENLPLQNARIWQDANSVGDDRIVFALSTQRGTQANVNSGTTRYGTGKLVSSVLAGVTAFQVLVEDGATVIFRDGDLIRITDRATPASVGNEQWVRISGTPGVSGNTVSITVDTPLLNNYLSADTKVSSVLEVGTVSTSRTYPVVTSSNGAVTISGDDDIDLFNIGTVEQTWTLTFASTTGFNIVGDTLGAIGSGNIVSTTAPVNPQFGIPYFSIPAAVFGGVFAPGDTIVFSTSPCAIPLFLIRTIPVGAGTVSNNSATFYLDGESD